MVDSARELRTSILVSTVYPPLPVRVSKVEPDSMRCSGESELVTTHTILAKCLDAAALRDDPAENARRRARQLQVFRRFLHAMAERGFGFKAPDLYSLYAAFTREHIATYFPEGSPPPGIEILPYDHMTPGDKAHTKLVEYVCAQSILFDDPEPLTPSELRHNTLAMLLEATRARLGHIATPDERSRIPDSELEIEEI